MDPTSVQLLVSNTLQILVDGPASEASQVVPRHSAPLSNISLTPQVLEKLPRAIGNGALRKVWEKAGVEAKFAESQLAKNRAQRERRRQLNDFERFKVMRLKKQVRFEQKKALAKIKASA